MADWSELTKDVLQFIANKLELPDYHRFGAVCQNWQSAAKAKRCPLAKQLPWLLLGEDNKTKKRVFFSLSESKHYFMDIPELHRHVCRGSSHGWVFTVDREFDARLLNPLTWECFKLPPLPYYSARLKLEDCKALQGKKRYRMQCGIVRKAILSNNPSESNDFTLVITFGSLRSVAFWRPGDPNWSLVDCSFHAATEDVTFFKGKLYAFTVSSHLAVVDLGPHPKMTQIGPHFSFIKKELMSREAYLVDLAGESLILIKRIEADDSDDDDIADGDRDLTEEELAELRRQATDEEEHRQFVTKELVVFELDVERAKCFKRGDIDGSAIFVGSSLLVVIDPSQVAGCVPDRISYTGMNQFLGFSRTRFYDMVSETVGEYSPSQFFIHHPVSPTWFTPNPW